MIGWLITLAALLLVLWMKVGVSVKWDTLKAILRVRIGYLRFVLWPNGKPQKEKERKTKKSETVPVQNQQKRSLLKKWITAIWEEREGFLHLIGKAMEYPVLDRLYFHMNIGNLDPAVCAMKYGAACATVGNGLAVLYRTFQVRKQDVDVICRYDLAKTYTEGEVEMTIRVYLLIALCFSALRQFLKVYQSTKMTEKAVQNK